MTNVSSRALARRRRSLKVGQLLKFSRRPRRARREREIQGGWGLGAPFLFSQLTQDCGSSLCLPYNCYLLLLLLLRNSNSGKKAVTRHPSRSLGRSVGRVSDSKRTPPSSSTSTGGGGGARWTTSTNDRRTATRAARRTKRKLKRTSREGFPECARSDARSRERRRRRRRRRG